MVGRLLQSVSPRSAYGVYMSLLIRMPKVTQLGICIADILLASQEKEKAIGKLNSLDSYHMKDRF